MISEEIRKKYADGTRGVNPEIAAARDVIVAVKQQKLEQSRQEETALRQAMVDTSKQWNRQRQAALRDRQQTPAAPEKTAAQKRDEAQQLYDAYIQSDEYKQNLVNNMKDQTDEWMNATLYGSEGYTPAPRKDQKEQELKALVDHYTAQAQKEEDQATLSAALQELETWDEADRKALEAYWVQDTWERQHPMVDPLTGGSRQVSGEIAAPLFVKYGEAKVRKLAEALEWQQSAELAEQTQAKGRETAGERFFDNVGADALSIAEKGVGNLSGLLGYVTDLGRRTGQFSTLNPNNIGQLPNVHGDAIQGQKAENLAADGGKLDAYLYQGGMSAADSGLRIVMGGGAAGGAVLSATGSFARTVSEASSQGATPEEAAALGIVNAGIEYATEKVPLDKLMDAAKAGGHGWKEILKNALLQGGIEAGEEELSLIGTTLAEAAILREKSGYQQRIQELVASGMNLKDAQNAAFGELMQEAKETAIVSFFSGGLSEAGASVAGNLTHRADDRAEDATEMQQTEENAAENAAPVKGEPEAAVTPEEAAEQLGRESSKAEPVQKTEQEITLDQAMRETFGQEGNDFGSRAADLERAQAQEESLRGAAEAYANAGDARAAAEVEADRQKYGDRVRSAQDQEEARTGSLTDQDAPAPGEAPYPGSRNQDSDPLQARSWAEAGSRKTKAYMAENPEVKPFIQQEAQAMAEELSNTTKGERTYDEQLHYDSGGEKGWYGVKRHTSEDIAELRDSGMSYEQIDKGLNDIIEDHGKENSAAAKRVEMQLNDRLRNGRKDFMTGKWVQPNQAYIDTVNEAEANREGREGFDALMEDADTYAPPAQDAERGTQQTDTGRVSPQGEQHGMKGTGAAESDGFEAMGAADQNFSNKPAYNATLSEDNAQPDRAGDVRPMELPQRDINGRRVSAVTGNVYAAGITPDEFASLMEEPTARGDFSYIPLTNNQATQNATEYISRLGWDDAYHQWAADVRQGMAGAAMSARGALFLNHAAQAGDRQLWLNVLSDFQRLGTNTAQGLQAFRIVRQLAPSDRLYLIRRSVQQMVDDMHLRVPIEIDQDMADRYQNAPTNEEADAILDEIMDDVAAQIPSTVGERWTALRYVNMLGNLRTQVRNISGNVGARAAFMAKDQIAATLEKAVAAVNPNFQRTKSNWVSRELKDLGRADFEEIRDVLLDGGRFDDARRHDSTRFAREVNERRRIFRSGIMERYRQATNWAMNNEYFGDAGFARSAYARAFGGYLKANGFTGSTLDGIDQNLLDNARLYAIQQAQESTFRDRNALSDWISGIGRRQGTPAAIRAISEGVMPFRRTPANVLIRAEEFSPLGIINTSVMAAQRAAGNSRIADGNGIIADWARAGQEISGTDVVESMAKTLTGTGLFFMGMLLGGAGLLTGGPDADEEKDAFDKENGEQNYALQLPGGENVTIDWLSPIAVPMFLGSAVEKIISDGDYTIADFEKVFTSLADPLIQMSMLQGVNDTLDDLKYSQNNLGQFFLNAAVSYLTQGLTNTLMGQIEKSTESERTTTYVDKDSNMPAWAQRQLGKVSQKIPFWDYQQTPYINARGETQTQRTDLLGWLYNLTSPGYVNKFEVDSVSEELYRLHETGATESNVFLDSPSTTVSYTDKDGVTHKDYNLTAEEADTLKRVTGQTSVEALKGLFESETYKAMTDRQKAKAVELAYDYAREKGRTAALEGYEGLDGWMEGIEGNAAEAIINRTVEAAFSDAFSLADRDQAAAAEALDQAYSLLDPNDRLFWAREAGSKEVAFIMAKARKIDTQTFTGLYQQYKDIGKDESLDNSQKAQEWADVLQKAQEAGDLTKAQKEGLKKDLIFYNQIPASSAKYDTMTNQGMDSDSADYIVGLLDGIKGTGSVDKDTGKARVTDWDKYDAVAGSKLTEEEKDIAMKAYMDDYDPSDKTPDYTEVKYDYIRKELGYSAKEYAAAARINAADGKKEAKIDRIEEKLGITDAQARELYGYLNLTKSSKAKLVDWAEELYG